MRELKAYIALIAELNPVPCQTVYLKSEADKVIAEMEKQAVLLSKALNTISESHKHVVSLARKCNHANYKRCLAMAEACMHKRWRNDEGFDYARSTRHMKKWLDIAEKFK